MKITEVLFDADGVVIKNRGRFFSEKYAEEYGVPLDQVAAFFKQEYGKCARGQADLKEVLPQYLNRWGWEGTINTFLNYWFESERDLEARILACVDDLRSRGIRCSIVSDQEKYRAEYLMTETDLGKHFDRAFFSMDLGFKKSEVEFFSKVLGQLKTESELVMYWDDDSKNIDVAKQIGIDGRTYVNWEDFEKQIMLLLG